MEINEIQLIKNFERDTIWYKKNKDILREEFKNNFVAVKDKDVIVAKPELQDVLAELKLRKIDAGNVIIEFIPEKNITVIY